MRWLLGALVAALAQAGAPGAQPAGVAGLSSPDASTRLRALQALTEQADPDAAIPAAKLLADPREDIRLAAIAAELNMFLDEKIVPRKRVGLVVEVRSAISAEAAFSSGPLALGPKAAPAEVLAAMRAEVRDSNPRIGLEALYAFGALAGGSTGAARRELLTASGPDLAALVGAPDVAFRFAGVRVLGRIFDRRREFGAPEETVVTRSLTAATDARSEWCFGVADAGGCR